MADATREDDLTITVDGVAVGGEGVGRAPSGKAVFVAGALPGEAVKVQIIEDHKRHARGLLVDVEEASTDRIDPACPHVCRGCGGCGWAHVDHDAQRRLKVDVVTQTLQRLGGIPAPSVHIGDPLPSEGFRTSVRAAVTGGRGGYRTARGHDRVTVDSCRVAHPLVEEMLVEGRFGAADEVTLRVGAASGERLALLTPTMGADVSLPADVVVIGADELKAGRRAWIHEEVAGRRFRVSAESFFQTRVDGAEALVAEVGRLVAESTSRGATGAMADLYCGVGLFAATVGADRHVVAVERSRSSVADARVNLEGLDARVVRSALERWRPSPVDVVVADPARHGLARDGVSRVDATGAECLVLVSCDAGALGRDAGLLATTGWTHDGSTLVDLFPDTPHVEVVSRFVR